MGINEHRAKDAFYCFISSISEHWPELKSRCSVLLRVLAIYQLLKHCAGLSHPAQYRYSITCSEYTYYIIYTSNEHFVHSSLNFILKRPSCKSVMAYSHIQGTRQSQYGTKFGLTIVSIWLVTNHRSRMVTRVNSHRSRLKNGTRPWFHVGLGFHDGIAGIYRLTNLNFCNLDLLITRIFREKIIESDR